jgi:hypothetical protein
VVELWRTSKRRHRDFVMKEKGKYYRHRGTSTSVVACSHHCSQPRLAVSPPSTCPSLLTAWIKPKLQSPRCQSTNHTNTHTLSGFEVQNHQSTSSSSGCMSLGPSVMATPHRRCAGSLDRTCQQRPECYMRSTSPPSHESQLSM